MSGPRDFCKLETAALKPRRAFARAMRCSFWAFKMRSFELIIAESVRVSKTINAIAPMASTRANALRFLMFLYCMMVIGMVVVICLRYSEIHTYI